MVVFSLFVRWLIPFPSWRIWRRFFLEGGDHHPSQPASEPGEVHIAHHKPRYWFIIKSTRFSCADNKRSSFLLQYLVFVVSIIRPTLLVRYAHPTWLHWEALSLIKSVRKMGEVHSVPIIHGEQLCCLSRVCILLRYCPVTFWNKFCGYSYWPRLGLKTECFCRI